MKVNFYLLFLALSEVIQETFAWPSQSSTRDDDDESSNDSRRTNKTNANNDAFYESLYIDAYESMTAEEKQNILFQELELTQGTRGDFPNILGLARLILGEGFTSTMDTYSDFFPGKRGKGIHSVGPAAKVIFQPAVINNYEIDENHDNTYYNNSTESNVLTHNTRIRTILPTNTKKRRVAHPFTGLFAESTHGMLRLSLAIDLSLGPFTPGIGVKLLRDGMPSANFVAMNNVDGQESGNFFETDFSNHIPKPTSIPQKILGNKFARTSSPPELTGLSDIATYHRNGKKVGSGDKGSAREEEAFEETETKIVFPFELIVKPNEQLRRQYAKADPTNEALDAALTSIPEGTIMYTLYGRSEPKDKDLILIGTLQLTSRLIYSKFSDNGLFFRHQRIEEDLKIHPEWIDAIKDKLQNNGGSSLRGRSLLGKSTSKCPMAR